MIKDFINVHYHPSRMVLVATGAVDHDQVVALAKDCFTRRKKINIFYSPIDQKGPSGESELSKSKFSASCLDNCIVQRSTNVVQMKFNQTTFSNSFISVQYSFFQFSGESKLSHNQILNSTPFSM